MFLSDFLNISKKLEKELIIQKELDSWKFYRKKLQV